MLSLPKHHGSESRLFSCHYANLHPLHVSFSSISFCHWSPLASLPTFLLSVSVSLSVTLLCVSVCICLCVSLQEAELAARILLDQGQVTVWGSPRWEEGLFSPQEGGAPAWFSSLCFFSFYSSPFLSPSPCFPAFSSLFSEFPDALRSFIILSHPLNHLPVSFLPKFLLILLLLFGSSFLSFAPTPSTPRLSWRLLSCLFSSQPDGDLFSCRLTLWRHLMALSLLLSMAPPNPNGQRYSPTMMWDSTVRTFTSSPISFWEEAGGAGGG